MMLTLTGESLLRTVPTIVSAHMFCTSRDTWFSKYLGAYTNTEIFFKTIQKKQN